MMDPLPSENMRNKSHHQRSQPNQKQKQNTRSNIESCQVCLSIVNVYVFVLIVLVIFFSVSKR